MSIFILGEHEDGQLKSGTLSCVTAAQQLGEDIHLVLIGSGVSALSEQSKSLPHVKKIHVLDHADYAQPIAELVAPALAAIAADAQFILAPASTFGKNILPRLAATFDIQPLSDVIAIHGPTEFTRPIYAGNALQRVKSEQKRQLMTIRPTAFAPVATSGGSAEIVAVTPPAAPARPAKFVNIEQVKSARPELTSARIVVSGGRALGSAENFKIIEALADKLGAAVGASRAAVDAGYVPNDYQVGQTGKIVAPDLYMAIGMSGAIQHLAGMSGSQVIVAINKDPDAPIFQVADYGLVADLFEAVPELMKTL
ncbi:MAG TPA: FAD-binding protein [Alphaproteobacteria bacterium]